MKIIKDIFNVTVTVKVLILFTLGIFVYTEAKKQLEVNSTSIERTKVISDNSVQNSFLLRHLLKEIRSRSRRHAQQYYRYHQHFRGYPYHQSLDQATNCKMQYRRRQFCPYSCPCPVPTISPNILLHTTLRTTKISRIPVTQKTTARSKTSAKSFASIIIRTSTRKYS